jgi:hypothetical protein
MYDVSELIIFNKLTNILPVRLDEISRHHECGFQHNRQTSDLIHLYSSDIREKWEYSGSIHQLFIDFKISMTQERSTTVHSH